MTDGMSIRPLAAGDKDQWLVLWAGYNDFYKRVGPSAVLPDVTELLWQRLFDAAEPMHAFVAADGRKILGFVHLIYHRNTTMIGPVCYLQDLFTAREARGKGVGRALIEAVYAHARAAGSPRVYWQTQESNTTAQALYDTLAEKSDFLVYRKSL